MDLVRLVVQHGRLNRGMVPKPLAPSGRARWDLCGLVGSGSDAALADPRDELGFAWDDPAVAVDWPSLAGTPDGRPILSERDGANPPLVDLLARMRADQD